MNFKRRSFLKLLNNNCLDIKSSYTKGGQWTENFGFSNSLCVQATWAITNYTPIGEYWLHFFPRKDFSCLCRSYSIKTRCHIFYDCRRFNKSWNLRRETISQFIPFLEYNPNKNTILSWLQFLLFFLFFFFFISFLFSFVSVLFNVATLYLIWSAIVLHIIDYWF